MREKSLLKGCIYEPCSDIPKLSDTAGLILL
jgi:hypothetical protein